MKALILSIVVAALPAAAQAFICTASVVHTPCGSGDISVRVNEVTRTFDLHDGDVHCWATDSKTTGTVAKVGPRYPYNLDKSYELMTRKGELKGHVYYDDQEGVARLEIVQNSGTKTYNLSCKPTLDVEVPGDSCMKDCGRDCMTPPIFCGQW